MMKLAEALQERADINSRLAELYPRLSNNAIVQEGEKPAEDPQSLIDEIESCTARLAELNHLATPTMDWQSPASLYGKNSLILENKQ